ncbi:MAG: [protein-PII] uridylyltransferase [Polyangiaceae bacterium]
MTEASATVPLLSRVQPSLSLELGRYLSFHRAEVAAQIKKGGSAAGLEAATHYSRAIDGLLGSLYSALDAAMRCEGSCIAVTLAAVGSYGRGAVSFASDLDLRLLCPGGSAEAALPVAEALLYPLWDTGLSIGHQVVTQHEMIELARQDLPTATSLLDWRSLAGPAEASERLLAQAFEGIFGLGQIQAFLDRLGQRATERAERYGGSVYLLEPDVKNGPGGLRDMDIACWAARARFRVRDLADLVKLGVLVPREHQRMADAAEFMWRVRNLLHVHAGRRSDRLSFDRQETLAQDLGYGDGGPAVEHFMSDYYRSARELERARDMMLSRAAPPPTRRPHLQSLGRGLVRLRDTVTLAHPAALDAEPALALGLYEMAVRRDLGVNDYARDAVLRATTSAGFAERLRESPAACRSFLRLLTTAKHTRLRGGSVLSELHDVGLLTAMIPEFLPVVGRVHHDVYHVYTVDAHSIAAVDRLRMLVRGDLAAEHPLASRLAAEIARPNVLYLATLLHDVGKDIGGRNHSERGAGLAPPILARLGIGEGEVVHVQNLIAKHLRMYHVATRRDIDDPETIAAFAEEVRGREGLRELYLLTLADVSTTSPTAMTSWKARMLDELFRATDRYLSQGQRVDEDVIDIRRELARERLREQADAPTCAFAERFLRAIPERYLLANDADDVARHARFSAMATNETFAVDVLANADDHAELGFVADDRPGLLALVTAALAASRLDVVGAQIYSWQDGDAARVLDLFWVRAASGAAAIDTQLPKVRRDLAALLSGAESPAALVGKRAASRGFSRRRPEVATEVKFDDRATGHTVLEVITRDRPALLFWLAFALQEAGLSISIAKINTEGDSVADVFYVVDQRGAKIDDPRRIEEIRQRIVATIDKL